jgi:hypothetical protein
MCRPYRRCRDGIEGEADDYCKQVQLAHPDQEWKLHNAWFVKQLNFLTKFRPLETGATAQTDKVTAAAPAV